MKTYDLIVTNGCSFVSFPFLTFRTKSEHKIIHEKGGASLVNDLQFGMLLAKKFDCASINLAKNGSSNERIFRTTFNFLNYKKFSIPFPKVKSYQYDDKKDYQNILCIIGLSDFMRGEIYNSESKRYLRNNSPGQLAKTKKLQFSKGIEKFSKTYFTYFHDKDEKKKITERNMILFDSYCKTKNIDLFYFSSFTDNPIVDGLNYIKFPKDSIGYYGDDRLCWSDYIRTYCDEYANKTWSSHPTIDDHNIFANYLFDYFKDVNYEM